jgi:rhodanese-related sulfurtransferase
MEKRTMTIGVVLRVFLIAGLLATAAACRTNNLSSEAVTSAPTTQAITGTYQTLTIDAFANILANSSDVYSVLNVHIPYEGEIDGTDASVPYNDIEALAAALPDKNSPIILYCRSGNMSEQAAHTLLELGYTQVWDVPGGMNAWRESRRELINE